MNPSEEELFTRLKSFRKLMQVKDFHIFIISSTDQYLNEYIPLEENEVTYLTGFTGSTATVIITLNNVFLFVDGRYFTQAELETPKSLINVVKVTFGISINSALRIKLKELVMQSQSTLNIALDTKKISHKDYCLIQNELFSLNFNLVDSHSLIEDPKLKLKKDYNDSLELIPISITGKSTNDKLKSIQNWLIDNKYNYFLITQLDDISYLTNLRSYSIPYNSTIKAICILGQSSAHLFVELDSIPQWLINEFKDIIQVHPKNNYTDIINKLIPKNAESPIKIGFDTTKTPYHKVKEMEYLLTNKDQLINTECTLSQMKRIKNPEELQFMTHSFHQADIVVKKAIDWLNTEINNNKSISEKDFNNKVKDLFFSHKAKALSFNVITASGTNSAIVHYTNPDPNKILQKNEFMLLDTGAYFEGGYATDLTRTFIIGANHAKPTHKQREIYTLVLKASIRVMKSKFPLGTKGVHLDTIARSVLWDYNYIYNHGTGHGVGICVHEIPPRLSVNSKDVIEENMVFSVEPGIYLEGFGGVRIENIVTVKVDRRNEGWLRIEPLTYAPLDNNLIDETYLDHSEREWLMNYQKKSILK